MLCPRCGSEIGSEFCPTCRLALSSLDADATTISGRSITTSSDLDAPTLSSDLNASTLLPASLDTIGTRPVERSPVTSLDDLTSASVDTFATTSLDSFRAGSLDAFAPTSLDGLETPSLDALATQ